MTIGIDIRHLAKNTRSGVEEYTAHLLDHMFRLEPNIRFKLFYNAARKAPLEFDWGELPSVEVIERFIPNRFLDASSRTVRLPKIDRIIGGCDVFFSPHFLLGNVSRGVKRVVTFHDLSFEHFPEFFSRDRRVWHSMMNPKKQAREADAIIAVSQSTKDDLVYLYGIDPDTISVIHSGISPVFRRIDVNDPKLRAVQEKYRLPNEFILYFGTIEPRKNIGGLIKAFSNLRKLNFRGFGSSTSETLPKLVIAGERGWLVDDVFRAANSSSFRDDILFTGFVDEDDKPYLYPLATLFVYPSFFEGFGFPVLEAMSCGVPVITSHTSSFPEVTGGAALMVDPYDVGEISHAMELLLHDKALRNRFIEKGYRRAGEFSWEKSAGETLRVFHSLA